MGSALRIVLDHLFDLLLCVESLYYRLRVDLLQVVLVVLVITGDKQAKFKLTFEAVNW